MPGRNYDSLYQALKRFERWGKLTESTWAIVSNMNHVQIRDYLMQYMDKNYRLAVVTVRLLVSLLTGRRN